MFRKPKAIITISRPTGIEEVVQITVNAWKLDRKDIYKVITEAGEALKLRLLDNNADMIAEEQKDKVKDLKNKKLERK